MEKKKLWRILLVLGMIPFVIPFLGFVYEMLNSSSWTLFEYWFLTGQCHKAKNEPLSVVFQHPYSLLSPREVLMGVWEQTVTA